MWPADEPKERESSCIIVHTFDSTTQTTTTAPNTTMSASLRVISTLRRSASVRPAAATARFAVAFTAPKFAYSSLTSKKTSLSTSVAPLLRHSSASLSTNVDRPISPHVTIYAFPVPALASITNRATGVALSVGVMGMSFVALGGGCDIPAYVETLKTSVPVLMPLCKMLVAFPVVYHTVAGVRHMYWDKTAKGLDLDSVEGTSKIVIGASAFLTLILGFYSIPAIKA